jgi:hypothetical protein
MKTLNSLLLIYTLSVIFAGIVYSQGNDTSKTVKDTLITRGLGEKKNEKEKVYIVINMEMINSFRRCYDKIEVIPWGDLFRSLASDDAGITWMAYKRVAYIPSADTTSNTSLAIEKEKIRAEMETCQPLKKILVEHAPEDMLADKRVSQNRQSL